MEWKIYRGGVFVESAECVYDAIDFICVTEHPNKDFHCHIHFLQKRIDIINQTLKEGMFH